MAKKQNDAQMEDVELQAKMRLDSINQFNQTNKDNYFIDPVKTPTDEDVEKAKADLDEFRKRLRDKKYLVADKENAIRVCDFFYKWLDTCFWTQKTFIGVINLDNLLTDFKKEFEKEPQDFVLDFGAMQFCYHILENYAGNGIESARRMKEIYEEYAPIHDALQKHVDWYTEKNKIAEELDRKASSMGSGYYYQIIKPLDINLDDNPVSIDGESANA